MSDKRGYVKSSARVGDAEPMAASDVAFLAPELVSEAEGPVPVPAPAEGRLGYRFVKRAFDIAFSLCAIAVLLVPSIILCVAIRLESPGCPIYSQKRVGRIGRSGEVRTFDMYKFRSMHKDADERLSELQELNEADGPLFKIKDDPRVTRIGKFIRKHSIDELPQFLNCLIGQLSCVGPRPPFPSEVAQYDERAMRRLSVKPGLTGYWQVRGRSDTTFDDMVARPHLHRGEVVSGGPQGDSEDGCDDARWQRRVLRWVVADERQKLMHCSVFGPEKVFERRSNGVTGQMLCAFSQ